jgi:hypothetical protein
MGTAKTVRVAQYQQATDSDFNNISKFLYETLFKDIITHCIANAQCSVIPTTAGQSIVEQNTGSDYNVKVNPHLAIKLDGVALLNPVIQTIAIAQPVSAIRIDILQADFKYTSQTPQNRYFINPGTGVVSLLSTNVEFLIDMDITVKQGVEGSGTSVLADAGKIKLCEIAVPVAGGITNANIYNVTSLFGEVNTNWTQEQSTVILIKSLQQHRTSAVLDHPNLSVTIAKLANASIQDVRSMNIPSLYLVAGTTTSIHEITVPVGKTLTVYSLGISIINNGTPSSGVIIEIGSYAGGIFTQLNSTYQRNTYLSTNNTFAANVVVQVRITNSLAFDKEITGYFIYTIV